MAFKCLSVFGRKPFLVYRIQFQRLKSLHLQKTKYNDEMKI